MVFIDQGLLEARPELSGELANYVSAHAEALELCGAPLAVPGGEAVKSDTTIISRLHEEMLQRRLDRHSVALILGGGAVLDAVGFAAATFHRGVRTVRMPSTVLAQNDAGVGVKNGVNLLGVKNLVGAFQAPYAVLNDSTFLRTLSARDVRSGLAEAVKVALIRDASFYSWLLHNGERVVARDEEALAQSVRRAAQLHLAHISQGGDPFETGSARPLDFGHWAAHKLESLSQHSLRHGEAVAIGIAVDVTYSARIGLLSQGRAVEICRFLELLGFELKSPLLVQRSSSGLDVLRGLEEFREHIGGELLITLISQPGVSVDVREIQVEAMERAVLDVASGVACK